jgi:stage II sporulation SpoAA-like protein
MTWTLECDDASRTITAKLTGSLSGPDARELTSSMIGLVEKHGVLNVLLDTSEVESAPSTIDIFKLPAEQYVQENLSRMVRIAMVMPKAAALKRAALFYEAACVNRGWLVRSFAGRDEALAWLKGADSSN